MNPRNPYLSNSLAIRQEIQRFESVHPSIYALYDLIEAIPDMLIQQQIREHVVCIEGQPFTIFIFMDTSSLLVSLVCVENEINSKQLNSTQRA